MVDRFDNVTFKELNRDYHTIDGDEYYSVLPRIDFNIMDYVVSEETYENRIQASHSIFNYEDINPDSAKSMGLYDYPSEDNNHINSLLGYDLYDKDYLNQYLGNYNGYLGNTKQVKVWFLIFKNKPISKAFQQESYWKRGNKNEVVICIGTDKNNNIKWSHTFTWTRKESVKIDIRDIIANAKSLHEMKAIIDGSMFVIQRDFKRREFHEFDYLEIELPTSFMVWLGIFIFIISIGFVVLAIMIELR